MEYMQCCCEDYSRYLSNIVLQICSYLETSYTSPMELAEVWPGFFTWKKFKLEAMIGPLLVNPSLANRSEAPRHNMSLGPSSSEFILDGGSRLTCT